MKVSAGGLYETIFQGWGERMDPVSRYLVPESPSVLKDLVGNGSSLLVGAIVPYSQAWTERAPRRLIDCLPEPPNEQGAFFRGNAKSLFCFSLSAHDSFLNC